MLTTLWVGTKLNPDDDPTRFKQVRALGTCKAWIRKFHQHRSEPVEIANRVMNHSKSKGQNRPQWYKRAGNAPLAHLRRAATACASDLCSGLLNSGDIDNARARGSATLEIPCMT